MSPPGQIRKASAVFALACLAVFTPVQAQRRDLYPSSGAADSSPSVLLHDEFQIDVWNTDSGLPHNTVSSILQSPDGFLWCGTYDGVVRFDGVNFRRIGPEDPNQIGANRVMALHLDKAGRFWIGSDGGGLWRYEGGRLRSLMDPANAPFNSVRSLAEDSKGRLWIGSQGGLGCLENDSIRWFTEAAGYTNTAKSIWNLAFDRQERLWVSDWTAIRTFSKGHFEMALPQTEIRPPARSLYVDGEAVFAGMMGGAVRIGKNGESTKFHENRFYRNVEVVSFCRSRSGEFWVGTRRGLYCERGGKWTLFSEKDGLGSGEVRALVEDSEGNLWVGTGTAGLARIKRRLVSSFGARDGIQGQVQTFHEGKDGVLWLGMVDGRVLKANPSRGENWTEQSGLPAGAAVTALLPARDGSLWVGTFGNGLVNLKGGQTVQYAPSVGSLSRIDKVTALLEDKAGEIWVGSYFSLYKAGASNRVNSVMLDRKELRSPVTVLIEARTGGVWAACDGLGVARIEPARTTWLTRSEGLPTHFVRALFEDEDGSLWIGTTAGLSRWEAGHLTTFTKAHGLADDSISQITDDGHGHLWLGSNRGIMKVPKPEFRAVAAGKKNILEYSIFGKAEGMRGEKCAGGDSSSGCHGKDGKLWFTTDQGLVMMDTARVEPNHGRSPPRVYLEEIVADGRTVAQSRSLSVGSTREVVLAAGTGRVEFNFTALSFAAPERIRFRYRLEGYGLDWVEGGEARSAVFTKLPPGRYLFSVIASNGDGLWSKSAAPFSFRIAAPFWQQWWVMLLAGTAVAGAVAGSVRIVLLRQFQRKMQRLEAAHAIDRERMRIAQDMHDEIGGKLSRISFLSEMAQRESATRGETTRPIEEVSEAARDVIKAMDEIVWAVNPRNDTVESLAHYICRYAEEFFELTSIELEFDLPPEFPPNILSSDVRHNLFCAVKEALNNVLKHAEARMVSVAFRFQGDSCEISVRDDGKGFEMIEGGSRNGLGNMRQRLERLGGQCVLRTNPGEGTHLRFLIKLSTHAPVAP